MACSSPDCPVHGAVPADTIQRAIRASHAAVGYRMYAEQRGYQEIHAEEENRALDAMNAWRATAQATGAELDVTVRWAAWAAYWEKRVAELPALYRDGNPGAGLSSPLAPGQAEGMPPG